MKRWKSNTTKILLWCYGLEERPKHVFIHLTHNTIIKFLLCLTCISSYHYYLYFIYTFELVNLFPVKIYRNYFKEEIDADQCLMFNDKVLRKILIPKWGE